VSLLDLQRLAGNAAVAHLVQSTFHPAPLLQRYEAGEHAQFGAPKGKREKRLTINKIRLTYGEMMTMGDFFENLDDLKEFANKHPHKFKQLLEQVRKEKQFFTKPKGLPEAERHKVKDEVWDEILKDQPEGKRYLDMAAKNTSHFAPGPSQANPDVDHKHEWRSYHLKAIELARAGKVDEAFLTNAFGDHFLTDAFSAGHMINKDAVMAKAKAQMIAVGGHYSNDFTDKVADGLLKRAPRLYDYKIRTSSVAVWKGEKDRGWWDMNASSLSKVIFGAWDDSKTKEKFLSLFARFVHDDLNQLINTKAGGLLVENERKNKWPLSGDETLAASPDTLRIGRRAVARSQRDILAAKAAGHKGKLDPEKLCEAVWAYTPHPTADGQKAIDEAIDTYGNPKRQETVEKFIDFSVAQLDLSIKELKGLGRLRLKTAPEVVSHVTVAELSELPVEEKIRIINDLLGGISTSDKDVDACVAILDDVYAEQRPPDDLKKEMEHIQVGVIARVNGMWTKQQKKRVLDALVWDPAKVKVPAGAR